MVDEEKKNPLRYSVSLITQGNHKFYTLTMPSDVLAETCFVTRKYDDPKAGFQRNLDEGRAQQIADYIDNGFGTIPCSIVLSAQPEAGLQYDSTKKTIVFQRIPKAFLILDGQHRVYGFSKARARLRVPVVVYDGLSRPDETRLFIDINTKQRPVPNELLLDIKRLAQTESDVEKLCGELFDLLDKSPDSPLLGMMSSHERSKGKITRVTFYAAVKAVWSSFEDSTAEDAYKVLRPYLCAVARGLESLEIRDLLQSSTPFRAFMMLFPEVAQRVQDRFDDQYEPEYFSEVLKPVFRNMRALTFSNSTSIKNLYEHCSGQLKRQFSLKKSG